jgi:hypothetical protein
VAWSGAGDDGRRLPPAVYLARVRLGGLEITRRIVLLE